MRNGSIEDSITGLGIIGILFVALKLFGAVDWSWWAVLIPFYIGPLAVAVILGCYIVCVAWREIVNAIKEMSE
jgi:hypothetical protein